MKKIILSLAILLVLVGQSFAAGSCVISYGDRTEYTAEIIWTCTGDSVNGTIPDTTCGARSALFNKYPYAYRVNIENLSTDVDVTDDSDVYLYSMDSSGTKAVDIMNGQGVDQLDKDTTNYIRLNQYDELHGPLVLDVDNNSGASSVYRITLVVTK